MPSAWQATESIVKDREVNRILPVTRRRLVSRSNSASIEVQAGKEYDGEHITSTPRLLWFDEAPPVLQFNKYVRSGYRAGLLPSQCLCSLLQYHNETGNIYSHLTSALVLLGLLVSNKLPAWPDAKWAFYENVIPIFLCLFGSVIYHTFMANHWHYRRWILVDVCGVFLVLVSGAHAGMYWGLFCYPVIRSTFITAYFFSAAFCVYAGLRAKTQLGRAAPMLLLLMVRACAVLTRFLLRTGSQRACLHYLVMEVFAIFGAVVNVTRVPERWLFPKEGLPARCRKAGPFDHWLNSHQIMHIAVVIAMAHRFWGTAEDYKYHQALQSCQD